MAKNITGNNDGSKGGNDTYRIPGRGTNVSRNILTKEVKNGKHPDHGIYTRNRKEYVRAKPNSTKNDNVNK